LAVGGWQLTRRLAVDQAVGSWRLAVDQTVGSWQLGFGG